MTVQFTDRRQVRRGFARVATNYGAVDFLAREVDRRMQERLDFVRIEPKRIVDIGCSKGASLEALQQRYERAMTIGIDLVPEMLPRPGRVWPSWLPFARPVGPVALAADALQLPLASASVGLVWSNLLLHWLDHPLPVLAEGHRVLESGGLLMFSTLGPDTLKELRGAFGDGYAHVQRFADMHDLGDMLVACGFADPVMDMETLTLTYDSIDQLLAELKAASPGCAMVGRRRGLAGREVWQQVRRAYETHRSAGRLPATVEVIYGHAWKVQPRKLDDGRSVIRFETPRRR